VLNVCASGKTVAEAQASAYAAVDRIQWPEGFCRRDIGWQAVGAGEGIKVAEPGGMGRKFRFGRYPDC